MARRWARPLTAAMCLTMLLSLPGQAASRNGSSLPVVADAPFVFERAIPASAPASANWFDDAVFFGDARAREFLDAGLMTPGLALAQVGLDVRAARSEDVFLSGSSRLTLEEALSGGKYGKVYLMLGFNESVWMGEDEFVREYAALIDELHRLLPDAQLYLQTIIPVTVFRSASQEPGNGLLARRSELLRQLAREKRVYLLDAAAGLAQSDGSLPPELSRDGLHLSEKGNAVWYQYLRTHTMGT